MTWRKLFKKFFTKLFFSVSTSTQNIKRRSLMEIKLFREFSFIACLTAKTPISFLFCPNFFNPLNTRSEQTIYSTWKAISLIIWSLKKTRRHHYCLLLFPLPEYSNLTDGVQQSLAQKKKENSGENIFFATKRV